MNTSAVQLKTLTRWRNSTFLVMLFGYVGYYLCRKNLSSALPLLSDEFGYTNSDLGLIAFYSEMAYAIGKFINGPLSDKFGGRKFFLVGMVGAIACNLIFAQGSSLPFFISVWCVCRFFLSMGWPGLTKTIGNWFEPERNGTVMGWISINFQFGGVVSALFAGWLVSRGASWQDIFIYPAGVLFLVFIWSFFASRSHPRNVVPGTDFGNSPEGKLEVSGHAVAGSETIKEIYMDLFKVPVFRQLLLFSVLTTFLRSIFFFWIPKLLVDIGMGTSNAIFKSALFPLLGCVGTILLGWYTDKYAKDGDRASAMWKMLVGLVVSLITVAVCMFNGAESYQNIIVIALGFCGFFLLGPYSMSSGCLTLDIAGPHRAGSCTGLLDGLGYVGGAFSVWMAGYLSEKVGWGEVFIILSVIGVLSTFSAIRMSHHFRNS
jgi:sugar phosphate permease